MVLIGDCVCGKWYTTPNAPRARVQIFIAVQRLPGSQPSLQPAEPFAGEAVSPGGEQGAAPVTARTARTMKRLRSSSAPANVHRRRLPWLIKEPPGPGVRLGRVSEERQVSGGGGFGSRSSPSVRCQQGFQPAPAARWARCRGACGQPLLPSESSRVRQGGCTPTRNGSWDPR